jgi:glycosyltransferase involved in cell wall biosynthesis
LVVASMLASHRLMKTWEQTVDVYLSATSFYKNLYIRGGLPAEKISIKPNYISSDPGFTGIRSRGKYALFVARLDPEKGVATLLDAWKSLEIPLKIRGNGQLESYARSFVSQNQMSNVEFIGRLDQDELIHLRENARFLVWPSEGYYETFGLAAVECFAQGIPVIASNIGVMAEIVRDGETGLLYHPGDSLDLAAKVKWLWDRPEECERMGRNARKEYEEKYTADRSYKLLMDIYSTLLGK